MRASSTPAGSRGIETVFRDLAPAAHPARPRTRVVAAVAALDGGTVTPKVQTGFTIITKENVDGDGASAVYKSAC